MADGGIRLPERESIHPIVGDDEGEGTGCNGKGNCQIESTRTLQYATRYHSTRICVLIDCS